MTEAIHRAFTVTRLIVRKQRTCRVFWWSTLLYLLLYLYAIGDLRFHAWQGEISARFSPQPLELLFKPISPFYFEAIGLVQLLLLTYLVSPINLLIAMALALLVGLNIAFSYMAIVAPKVCYGNPAAGILSTLPGLLAGSACCGPLILIVLGVQASASLIAFFGWLVPIAVVLLMVTLIVNARRTNIEYLREMG